MLQMTEETLTDQKSGMAARTCSAPVDLVHLARQSLGNRTLETEILSLFRVQSALYAERIEHSIDPQARVRAAHTLRGSALGIGAWEVARLAERVESSSVDTVAVAPLLRELERAREYIGTLLAS